MLEAATGLHIPQQDEGMGVECVPGPPVNGLDTQSFQSWLVRLPVRSGGIGLRSLADTSPLAFRVGIEMALPHFVGERGTCSRVVSGSDNRVFAPISGFSEKTLRFAPIIGVQF